MNALVMKLTWFFFCTLLFSYNAWRCVDQYLLFETVTKSSQEGQELHKFPMICIGPEELSKEETAKLNMTPKGYQNGDMWKARNMTEEEVYDNLSLGFGKLVKKIKIRKYKMKNSGAYESVYFNSEELKMSAVQVLETDYYRSLKRSCLVFPHEHFPFGIQDVDFYMKNTKNAVFFVAPPGNAFSMDRKPNRFRYAKGLAEYAIEHTLRYSLNLDRDPCSEEVSWKEDECALNIINTKILETVNCTTPWLLKFARYLDKQGRESL